MVIKAIAMLNQHRRERTQDGGIVANLSDYRWARELLAPIFRSIVTGGLTDTIRKTCEAIAENEEVSEAELIKRLGLSKSTIAYRVKRAIKGGWLRNLETRRGYPFRLKRGISLPEDHSALPRPEDLVFEHPTYSNGYSNGPQPLRRVEQTKDPFECSDQNEGMGDDAIELYPDENESIGREPSDERRD
jgi:hypothetical protein